TYSTGFPKAKNLAKTVDKQNGKNGKIIGIKRNKINFSKYKKGAKSFFDYTWQANQYTDLPITEPETEQAKALEGAYAGFQPKPAVEVILVVMKPMAEKSYTEQALANGKGCTWLDECRIPYVDESIPSRDLIKQKSSTNNQVIASQGDEWDGHSAGRFPGNLLICDNIIDDVKNHKGSFSRFFSLDAWAERNLPYLIVPKAGMAEKNAGLDGFPQKTVSDGRKTPNDTAFQRDATPRKNTHPCTKPVKLMAYLISMASRPGDLVGDFAAGSGTTGIAAKLLGRRFIGIEKEEEYHKIAVPRFEHASLDEPVLNRAVSDIRKHEESREQQHDDISNYRDREEAKSDLQVLDLFSGIGGFSLGLEKAGFRTVAFCEIDDFARKKLRQHWPDVPIYEDIKELNYETLKLDGIKPDVIVGGFPCTDISIAGKRAGIEGEQSGLWKEFKRLIAEINPQWVIIENVANLRSNGLVTVLQDLREIGFDAEWHIIPASAVGAPHQRERIWIVAYPGCQYGKKGPEIFSKLQGQLEKRNPFSEFERSGSPQDRIEKGSTGIRRMADGVPEGLDKLRLKALGNAVVPQIPELIGKAILQVCDEVVPSPEENEKKPEPYFFSNMSEEQLKKLDEVN
ncbi:MAG: DNA (cytosine-5-)-methyltransferase, partial [Desulfobulbales bacterium]